MGLPWEGTVGTGELGAALSRLALRPEPPLGDVAPSLRRLGGFLPPTLFSIRTEPLLPWLPSHVISARPPEPFLLR